ncbi:MAG: ABC transporter permease, partial [Lachnospiraceae bacterium]|nr:ABC transporter permease [Lachnospiraceae bacterium]
MKVNNRKCITKMATRLLFSNKRRNLITIFAIILTAVLFTSLFTIMLSINASYETGTFRQLGGYAHGTFKDVTQAQEEKLIGHRNIKAYGERMVLGTISDEPFRNRTAEVSFMDDNTAKWTYIELEEGHMPAGKNEVIMDKEALKLLGYEPVLGESISLTFDIAGIPEGEGKYSDTFILTGYWEYDNMCPAHFINVSKGYVLELSEKLEKMGYDPVLTDLDVMLPSSVGVENKML